PAVNITSPPMKNRLRPYRSPSAPPVSMNEANVRVYASMIHWSPETPAPSWRWMVGSATFTTRLSSMGMNSPKTIATRTHHLRRSAPVPWGRSIVSVRAIDLSLGSRMVSEYSLILSECSLIVNSQPGRAGTCVLSPCRLEPPAAGSFGRLIHMAKAIRMVTKIPGRRSAAILERKGRVVADPVDLHVPAVIDHALGARVTDVDGNTLLDFSGGLGCQLVGYSHPKVVEAVQMQAAKVSHTDFSVIPYESYVELAERLVDLTGITEGK